MTTGRGLSGKRKQASDTGADSKRLNAELGVEDLAVAGGPLGLIENLKQGIYPDIGVLGRNEDVSAILDSKLTTLSKTIKEDGTYVLACVPLEQNELRDGVAIGRFVDDPTRIDEHDAFIDELAMLACRLHNKSVTLLVPSLCGDSHWCLTQVKMINGKIEQMLLWDPKESTINSDDAFKKFLGINAQYAAKRNELMQQIRNLNRDISKLQRGNKKANSTLISKEAQLAGLAADFTELDSKMSVFRETQFEHQAAKYQHNNTSCFDFVMREVVRRLPVLPSTHEVLIPLRDVDHEQFAERATLVRKVLVDTLITKMPQLQEMLNRTEKGILTRIASQASSQALVKPRTIEEQAAVIDNQWEEVGGNDLLGNWAAQEDFDHRLAVEVDVMQRKNPSLDDGKLFSLARRAVLIERAEYYKVAEFTTFFAKKPLAIEAPKIDGVEIDGVESLLHATK